MFMLMMLSALIALTTAQPDRLYASPIIGSSLINEQTIQSHGNAVVHASAPVVSAVPAIPLAAVKSSPLAYIAAYHPAHHLTEKRVSNYNVLYHQPAIASAVDVAPSYYL